MDIKYRLLPTFIAFLCFVTKSVFSSERAELADPNNPAYVPEKLKDPHHGVKMGQINPLCDDAKVNISIDFKDDPRMYTCYHPKAWFPFDVVENLAPKMSCDTVLPKYAPRHYCMNYKIKYDTVLPTHEGHRPLWPVFGEYDYVPPQRWLHNIERVHPQELRRFDEYKEGWRKQGVKRKADAPADKMRQTKLFCSPGSQLTQPKVDNLIVKFVLDGLHSLSTVEEPGFIQLVTGLRPGTSVMSRRSLGRRIDEEWEKFLDDAREKLSGQSYVATTADIWSTHHRSFMSVTVHWIDADTLSRRSLALACRRFPGSHTYDRIAEMLEDIRQSFDISREKVVATVTDNASNFAKAFREFGFCSEITDQDDVAADLSFEIMVEPDNLDDAEINLPRHLRCACHTLSLVATSDAKAALSTPSSERANTSVMSKCSALWNYVQRPKSSEVIVDILGHSLKTPCVTRWNSLYDSMKDLLRSKDKLRDVCDGLNLQTFQERDLAFIAEYCEILQPIASALTRLQAQSDCFFGELLPTLFTVKSKLQEKAGMDFVYCRPLLDAVTSGFIRRFDELLRMKPSANEATVAAVLHPYFKLRWLSREPQDVHEHGQQLTEKTVIDFVNATKHTTRPLACAPSTSAASDVSADAFFSFEAHCGTSRRCQEDQVKLEFLSYLQDPRVEFDMLRSYPSQRSAFIRYNTPKCSSAPVERPFSFASLILRPHRGGLSDRRFEQMLLLKAAVPRVPS